jgi:Carboxypeptidase regulatory-like domain
LDDLILLNRLNFLMVRLFPGLFGWAQSYGEMLMKNRLIGLVVAHFFLTLSLLLLFPSSSSAQTFRGTVLGTVTDSSGAAVGGATVTIRNADTGLIRTATTAADGSYTVPELPIGNYAVTISKDGFETSVTSGVAVDVAVERRIDASLKPGAVTQKVEVSAESLPQVETASDTLGGTFENREILDLPINGRDYTKMLIMVPGAVGEPNGGGDSPGSFGLFSANGSRGRANNFLLDGTDMNDGYRNLPAINQGGVFGTPGTVLPLDAVSELKVLSNFEAEYGRNSGAVVNIVTKSGTNDIHGTAFEDFRNSVLDARNFFNTDNLPKDAFRNNQYGGSVGGPIVRNKTFFYLAYEGQREGLDITSENVVPTLDSASPEASSANDYAQAVAAIGGNPAACTTTVIACVDNQPAGVINPVILNLYNFCNSHSGCSGGKNLWPLPNISGAAPGAANSADPASAYNNVDSMIVKIDQNLGAKNQLSGRYFFGNSNQSFPLGLAGGNNLPNTNTYAPIRTQLVSISDVTEVSSNQVNEARFGWNRYRNGFYAADAGVFGNPETSLGLDNAVTSPNDFGLPTMDFTELSQLGSSPYSNARNRVDTNWQLFDNYTWTFGRHELKVGYEFRRTAVNLFNDFSGRGVLEFDTLGDFLTGALDGGREQVGNTNRRARQNNQGAYLQDAFRIKPRVTLNLGVRWDYFGVIHDADGLISAYDPTLRPYGITFRNPLYDKDFKNFAPRLSAAWDVFGKGTTVVRSGFGVFYDDFSQDAFFGQLYENSYSIGTAYNPAGPDPIYIFEPNTAVAIAPGTPIFVSNATSDVSTVQNNMRTPYVYNYNLNIQQALFRDTTLEVGYVGSAGRKLLRLRDLNQPTHAEVTAADLACMCINDGDVPRPLTTPLSPDAPYAPYAVNQLESTATSNYNSLQVSLTQRHWRRLTNQIAYTWSHSIDTASDSQDYVPNAAMPQDSNNVNGDKGPSNYDVRNRFVWSSVYEFPQWSAIGRAGSGWSVAGVLTLMSGHPFSINYDFLDDYSGGGEFYDRPDVVGPIQYNQSDPANYLNLSSFSAPCNMNWTGSLGDGLADSCQPGTRHYGDLGRNALIGPDYRNFDLALSKLTSITERLKLMFRLDAYNLTNHPNFANPLAVAFFANAAPNRSATAPNGIFDVVGPNPNNGRSVGSLAITATSDVGLGNPVLGGGGQRSFQLSAKFEF